MKTENEQFKKELVAGLQEMFTPDQLRGLKGACNARLAEKKGLPPLRFTGTPAQPQANPGDKMEHLRQLLESQAKHVKEKSAQPKPVQPFNLKEFRKSKEARVNRIVEAMVTEAFEQAQAVLKKAGWSFTMSNKARHESNWINAKKPGYRIHVTGGEFTVYLNDQVKQKKTKTEHLPGTLQTL